jgi:predicted ATP-grasp superfamily ATP-dependent carboligase
MATEFLETEALVDAVESAAFDRPPAFVSNAHVTGLSVARALADHDVPVVALDRSADGVAPPSDAVDLAGRVTYPLDDPAGFRADVERVAAATGHEPVAFPCMDEWVHAYAETTPEGVRLPFADADRVAAVLDKFSLYDLAHDLGVPYPETYRLDRTDPDEAADALGFPLVVKPARKREMEEALGTNVLEVADREEFRSALEAAADADVAVMAQEKVRVTPGADCSLASYVPPDGGDALGVVGNARVRHPQPFGTSCLVETVDRPEIRERATAVLAASGYYGISEAEFVHDADRDEYVLLDVNTRPWKWISLPVAAGANLPMAAYADATDGASDYDRANADVRDARWVYLRDYLEQLAAPGGPPDELSDAEWRALLSGAFERGDVGDGRALATGVYRPSDPDPAVALLATAFGGPEYYCAC